MVGGKVRHKYFELLDALIALDALSRSTRAMNDTTGADRMTTETTNDKPQILDVAQLRAALLDLLARANEALDVRPDATTAGDYAARLGALTTEFEGLSYMLSNAFPALRMLERAARRVDRRFDAVHDVFGLGKPADWTFTTHIGERSFLGDLEPVFPALGLDYTIKTIEDEDLPF